MFGRKSKITSEIILENGVYSHDITTGNIDSLNRKVLKGLINKEFGKNFTNLITHQIEEDYFKIESRSLCRDYMKSAVNRIIKEYNESR